MNKSSGPVRMHSTGLTMRGTIVEQGGSYGQTVFAVSGTNTIYIEGPFIGSLVAPNADAIIGNATAQQHWGVFQARSILVRSKATMYQLPWDYSL